MWFSMKFIYGCKLCDSIVFTLTRNMWQFCLTIALVFWLFQWWDMLGVHSPLYISTFAYFKTSDSCFLYLIVFFVQPSLILTPKIPFFLLWWENNLSKVWPFSSSQDPLSVYHFTMYYYPFTSWYISWCCWKKKLGFFSEGQYEKLKRRGLQLLDSITKYSVLIL